MRTRAAQPHLRLQASFFACSSFNPLFLFCVLTMRSCHLKAAPVLRTAAGLPCAHPGTWGTLLDLRAKFFYSWPGPPLARLRPALFHPFSIHYRSFQKGPSWVLVKTETCGGQDADGLTSGATPHVFTRARLIPRAEYMLNKLNL